MNRIRTLTIALSLLALIVAGCNETDNFLAPAPQPPDRQFAFVTTTDYQTGSASAVWLDGGFPADKNVAAIHSDAVARHFGGLIYVVNRFGADNIQILDPANGFGTVRQFTVGNGADPHDIAVVGETKAYVTRYGKTDLWIVDPSTGKHTGSIDLAGFADGDGIPEMDQLRLDGDRLFVTVQRIDQGTDWGPVGLSYLVVVDVSADTLFDVDPATVGVQAIALSGTNPFSDVQTETTSGRLYLACAGDWGVPDSGVELVNPVTYESDGLILDGAVTGGDITDVELVSAEVGFAIVTDGNFHNLLIHFNPATGTVTDTLYAPGSFVLQDVARAPTGELFLADRSPTKPGIRVYDAVSGAELTGGPIDVGLPPFKIVFGSVR
jgi:DNA-binding beta-propeller fold protein YncE